MTFVSMQYDLVYHLAAEEAVLHVEEEHLGGSPRGARIVEITESSGKWKPNCSVLIFLNH